MAEEGISLFIIDSKDRVDNISNSSTDCVFQFNPGFRAQWCEVVNLTMPMSQYNINTSNNAVYFFNGSNLTFYITPGNYSVYDLIATLEAGFNSVSAGYTVTYSNVSMKITITCTSNWYFTYGTYNNRSSAYILGFNEVNGVSQLAHTSDNAIDLSLPLNIYCNIAEFNSNVKSSLTGDMATFVFPNSVNGSDVLNFNENCEYKQFSKINEANCQGMAIRFFTRGGTTLDINNNDWTMTLRLHY
jgi:hypothetical protein